MSGTQQHQDGGSIRLRAASGCLRIPAPPARARHFGKIVLRRRAGRAAVLAGLPILILGLAAGTAAASGAGKVKSYTGKGISAPSGIAAGPDGALWFTNQAGGRHRLDRADHHPREGHQLHQQQQHLLPGGDHGRPGRGAVVRQLRRR